MKRSIICLLAVILCLSAPVSALAVVNPAFSVKIAGTLDSEVSFNGQGTLIIDWQIMANREGLTLRSAQGLRLAYDNSILQLMSWEGAEVIADDLMVTTFSAFPQAGFIGDFDTGLVVSAAHSASGGIGYLNFLLGGPYDSYTCPQSALVSLAQVRFAFRSGKSASDLTEYSIRCMTINELNATAQSTAVLLNTDENDMTSYEYLKQAGGAASGEDTLNAPDVTFPGSTVISDNPGEMTPETPGATETPVPSESPDTGTPVPETTAPGETPVPGETPAPGETIAPGETTAPGETSNSADTTPPNATDATPGDSGPPWLLIGLLGATVLVLAAAFVVVRLSLKKRQNEKKESGNKENEHKEDKNKE